MNVTPFAQPMEPVSPFSLFHRKQRSLTNSRITVAVVAFPLVAFALVGCFRNTKGSPAKKTRPLQSDVRPRIVGAVKIDDKPVEYFGVSVSKNHLLIDWPQPLAFESKVGNFAIAVAPGVWSLIITAPGYARRVVTDIAVGPHDIKTLTVHLERGHVVDGVVTDGTGKPVIGAVVEIVQNQRTTSGDSLWELSRGNHSTLTDKKGGFRIEGIASVGPAPLLRVSASSADHGASLPELVSGTTTVQLKLRPVGRITGTLVGSVTGDIIVARSTLKPSSMLGTSVKMDGTFSLENVPEGDWELGVFETSGKGGAVLTTITSVTAGQAVEVTLQR